MIVDILFKNLVIFNYFYKKDGDLIYVFQYKIFFFYFYIYFHYISYENKYDH